MVASEGPPREHDCPSQATSFGPLPMPRNPRSAPTATVHSGGGVKVVVNGPRLMGACPVRAVPDMFAPIACFYGAEISGGGVSGSGSTATLPGQRWLRRLYIFGRGKSPGKVGGAPDPHTLDPFGSIPTRAVVRDSAVGNDVFAVGAGSRLRFISHAHLSAEDPLIFLFRAEITRPVPGDLAPILARPGRRLAASAL